MRSTIGKQVATADSTFTLGAREDGMAAGKGKEAALEPAHRASEGWTRGRLAQGRPRSRIRHPRMGP
jgi:hypothetical protein